MEQRIGRIDRVRSHTERRLVSLKDEKSLDGKDMLQVYFPHLEDTIEILQVQKVLERMNIFLRLMHEGIISSTVEEKSIDSNKEFARGSRRVAQISGRLHSAFPVQPQHLMGHINRLESDSLNAKTMESRFYALAASHLPGLSIEWEPKTSPGVLMGTARIGSRVQPFSLILKSIGAWPSIRCISPIGCLKPEEGQEAVADSAKKLNICIGAIITHEIRTYDLTVESDVLLARDASTDAARVEMLIQQVVQQADQLEEYHLPGKDEPLPTFKGELEKEGSHER